MKTTSGTLNHLSYLADLYVDLIFHVDLFFDSTQIKLRPANGRPSERWLFTRARSYEHDEQWELLQRIGRFLGQVRVWGFFAVWSPYRDMLTNLYSVILFSSIVYNKFADEPAYSVTVFFQIDKEISCL